MSQLPAAVANAIRPPVSAHLFSQLVRQARERAGLSQGGLAARCGRTQSAVSFWEMSRPLKETTMEQVAAAFDMTLEDFLRQELGIRHSVRESMKARKRRQPRAKAAASNDGGEEE